MASTFTLNVVERRVCCAVVILCYLSSACASKRPNILFLVADDMRQELGSYCEEDCPSPVHPPLHTPYLDALSSRSLLLRRAYVQQAVCNPSRTSVLTGRRPDTTHVYSSQNYFRKVGGDFVTIPQYFKLQGYTSIGIGKIFHPGPVASGDDDPQSWSVPYYHAPNEKFWKTKVHGSWKAVPKSISDKRPLPDVQIAEEAVKVLRHIASNTSTEPFFLAVGFHKPHMPFIFPEEFLSLYPENSIRVPDNRHAPTDMPHVAFHPYNGILEYPDIKKLKLHVDINTTFPDELTRDLRRAYYSATSYVDSLIGWLLNELKQLGFHDNTIVSFWGDHGWQLGEHNEWGKQTNFELATHAPMMVSIPGKTDKGITTRHITEFVDLFPTLVEAAGFAPLPPCPEASQNVSLCTEGRSLLPLLNQTVTAWTDVAFSQFPRSNKLMGQVMGYTMRTEKFRYTEWVQFKLAPIYKPDWNKLFGVELYDHTKDPEENHNYAHKQEYANTRQVLSDELRAGWRGS